jgi:hypothetical protein
MKISNPNRKQRTPKLVKENDDEVRVEWLNSTPTKAVIFKDGRVGYIQRIIDGKYHVMLPNGNWPFPDWRLCSRSDFKNYNSLEGIEEAPF